MTVEQQAPESVIAVAVALHAGLNRSGYDRMIGKLSDSGRTDDVELVKRHQGIISMVRSGVTWGACTSCGRGRFLKSAQRAAVCELTIPCDGVMIPATAKLLEILGRIQPAKKRLVPDDETPPDEPGTQPDHPPAEAAGPV